MLELDRRHMGFKMRTVYFADHPYDADSLDWISFPHMRKRLDVPGFHREEEINAIIDLKKGPEQLLKNMGSKCRADIKKSEKEDLEIHVNENFEEFIELNSEFRRSKNIPPTFQYYLNPPLPDFLALLTARYQGEIAGGILFVHDDHEMYGMLAASKRLAVSKEETALIARANRRLWWEAVRWGSEQGFHTLDMGLFPAKDADNDLGGVGEFKRRFGAEAVTAYGYRKVYTRKARLMDRYRAAVGRLR